MQLTGGDGGVGLIQRKALIANQSAAEMPGGQSQIVHRPLGHANHVQVGQPQGGGLPQQVVEGFLGIGIGEVVEGVSRADAHTHPIGPGDLRHGLQRLQRETRPILHAAAVGIRALVAAGREELGRQVATGAMQLHAIKAGLQRPARCLAVLIDDRGNFRQLKCARLLHVLHAGGVCIHLRLGRNCRRCHGFTPGRLVVVAGYTPHVHDLGYDAAAVCVHGVGDVTPACHLRVGKNARRAAVTQAIGAGRNTFRYDQARAGTLSVVFRHQRVGHGSSIRTAACHGRHDDTIAQVQRTQFKRGQQIHGHS